MASVITNVYRFYGVVGDHYIYKIVWTPLIDEMLQVVWEDTNSKKHKLTSKNGSFRSTILHEISILSVTFHGEQLLPLDRSCITKGKSDTYLEIPHNYTHLKRYAFLRTFSCETWWIFHAIIKEVCFVGNIRSYQERYQEYAHFYQYMAPS